MNKRQSQHQQQIYNYLIFPNDILTALVVYKVYIIKDPVLTSNHCTHSLHNKMHIIYAGFKEHIKTGERQERFLDSTDLPLLKAIAVRKISIKNNQDFSSI